MVGCGRVRYGRYGGVGYGRVWLGVVWYGVVRSGRAATVNLIKLNRSSYFHQIHGPFFLVHLLQ